MPFTVKGDILTVNTPNFRVKFHFPENAALSNTGVSSSHEHFVWNKILVMYKITKMNVSI